MNKCIYIGFVLFLIIALSCEKQHFNDSIIGQWQWIKSTAGEYGAAITADTTFFIEFTSDGYYYFYNNSNILTITSKYELSFDTIMKSEFYRLLDMDHPEYHYIYNIKEDTLSVKCKECCPYCEIDWIPYYKRIK